MNNKLSEINIGSLQELVEELINEELEIKGRNGPGLLILKEKLGIASILSELMIQPNPIRVINDPKLKKAAITARVERLKAIPKADLILMLANLELSYEACKFREKIDSRLLSTSLDSMNKAHAKRLRDAEAKAAGRAKTFDANEQVLESVFTQFCKKYRCAPPPEDLNEFEKFLCKLHPTPPFIPNARIHKKHKNTATAVEDENIIFKRETWSKSKVRIFYESKIGCKATTLKNKKSLLKS